MRNKERESAAKLAAGIIRDRLNISCDGGEIIGLVLGTGWGDVLEIKESREISFSEIPGFEKLAPLEGHARQVVFGQLGDKNVIVLRGRVHLNEAPNDPEIPKMVRLQIEMLCALGVKTFILTSAVGSLGEKFHVGEVAIIDGFITLFAPDMPLYGGEFVSPEDMLDDALMQIACTEGSDLSVRSGGNFSSAYFGGHAMVRGPFFEGRRYDKRILTDLGASVVGMSILPEACIAALYDARVLALGFVTNDDIAAHSHEKNLARAKEKSPYLGLYLTKIVNQL